MGLTLRQTKGSKLTIAEMDSNFEYLQGLSNNMALSGLDDVLLTDISDKQLLAYDAVSEEWHNTSNVVLGNNSTAVETQYVAGESVTMPGAMSNQHTTDRRGAELTLTYSGKNVPQWDFTKLSLGVEIIDPTLTYRLQVVSLTDADYVLTVNAMSEAEAIAFAALYPSGKAAYGLCLAIPITTNHINTIILGDNITATDDNSIYADSITADSITISEAEIKDITIPGTPVWGAVLDNGTLLSDMVFAGTDRYLVYDAIDLTIFSIGDIIGFKESGTNNYWAFTITDVIEVEGTTTQVWVTETHGTLATAYDDSDWETYAVTITPESTHTALNVGTGNTIAHNNSHIIGNNIATDAENTLFVNNLKATASFSNLLIIGTTANSSTIVNPETGSIIFSGSKHYGWDGASWNAFY